MSIEGPGGRRRAARIGPVPQPSPLYAGLVGMLVLAIAAVAPTASWADGPVDESRQALDSMTFQGRVLVQWYDAQGAHSQTVDVEDVEGQLVVEGPVGLLSRDQQKYVKHGADWDLVWFAALGAPSSPALGSKYQLTYGSGPSIAGRATETVEIRATGRLVERAYVDIPTGLILGREQYRSDGKVYRAISFEWIVTGAGAEESLPAPSSTGPSKPSTASASGVPATLTGGYERVGAYRRSNVVQGLYSDGVYGLSVFRQRGSLRRKDVPQAAQKVALSDKASAWHIAWPGGEILMWQSGDTVYTVVGEAPLDDVLTAARSLPASHHMTFLDKLRRVCRGVLDSVI